MSTSGTPAGWYPDPENPGQTRYWDGAVWAAPSTPPPTAGAPLPPSTPPPGVGGGLPPSPPPISGGSSGSGGKVALIVGGVLLVLALLGGGVWALTSGGDDDGDDEVSTGGDDEGDDDGDGPEELDEAEFASAANDICLDFEGDLEDLGESAFEEFGDVEDPSDIDTSALESFADDAAELADGHFSDLRSIAPEGGADDWLDLVDEWEDVYSELFGIVADGSFETGGNLEDRYDDLVADLEDVGVDCLEGGSMADDVMVADDSGTGGGVAAEPGASSSSGSDVEQSQPTPPPAFDDTSFDQLGEDCYQGDMEACDELYFDSDFDTPEEDYGDRCGGRTQPGEVLCATIDDPTLP